MRARCFSGSFIIETPGETLSLFERTAVARTKGADLFLSIHHDSVQPRFLLPWRTYQGRREYYSDQFRGYSIW
jgi:N-acetylmuramoyl-L-alanine amidase